MKEPELKKISINKVKVDLDNPNKMTELQFEALKKTIEKYGYLVPIIVDKNLNIADGEHRYLAYKEMGMKEIPAYVLDIADPDRRMLRQVMNKLRGYHDDELDLKDFDKIYKQFGNLEELQALIPDEDLDSVMLQLEQGSELEEDNSGYENKFSEEYLENKILQIVLYFELKDYETLTKKFQDIMAKEELKNHTEVVLFLLKKYEESKSD